MKNFFTILFIFLAGFCLGGSLPLSFLADRANPAIVAIVFFAGLFVGLAVALIGHGHPASQPITAEDTEEPGGVL